MSVESISVICGVILVAVGCGLLRSIKLGDNEAHLAKALFRPRLAVVMLGCAMVVPYVIAAWLALLDSKLFAQGRSQVASIEMSLERATFVQYKGYFDIVVDSELQEPFRGIIASLARVPKFVSQSNQYKIAAQPVAGKPRACRITISVWPEAGQETAVTEAITEAKKGTIGIACVATSE